MLLKLAIPIVSFVLAVTAHAQHPVTFITKGEAAVVKAAIPKYPLLTSSYADLKADVDGWVGRDVDVPFPKDAAGGYTHDKHKNNYLLMFNSSLLYQYTGDVKYAKLVRDVLLKYAKLNPTLKNHPQATSSSPGRIFWQALNDANWLVYTGMAYDGVYDFLSPAERKTIEEGAFKPEVDFFTNDLESWFNLVHNHGVWACAGVGIVGLASGNNNYVEMALKGTKKDGKGGFLSQLDGLFSPDGYYTEGPYYVRYAILPYYLFANALQNARPQLNIFKYRDRILQKALYSGLQLTNTDGSFLPINDALKDKTYTSNELVVALGIAWKHYGADTALLPVAKRQGRVLVTAGGAGIAKELATRKSIPAHFPYRSVSYVDGAKGNEGGLSVLRTGKGNALTTLIFKYTSHGLSHGHYDKLNINLFDNGNEILSDYGSVRFINVEQKYGGRYLPENKTYAAQTIAHNTVVIDGKSHFDGKEDVAEKHHSNKLFEESSANVQAISAVEENAYKGTQLHRSLYMINLPGHQKPLIVDLYRTTSDRVQQVDLPFHYLGNLISTSFKYQPYLSSMQALGTKNGYQFHWKEAEAKVPQGLAQMTFLNGKSFYTISSLATDTTTVLFTRTGANDPNFNMRREPAYILRRQAQSPVFANVIEIHGEYNPTTEINNNTYSSIKNIKLLHNDAEATIVEIEVAGKKLLVAQANKSFHKSAAHQVMVDGQQVKWNGPFSIQLNNTPLK